MKERLRKLYSRLNQKGLTSEAEKLLRVASYVVSDDVKKGYQAPIRLLGYHVEHLLTTLKGHVDAKYTDAAAAKRALQTITMHLEEIEKLGKELDRTMEKEWEEIKASSHDKS